jgi:amino-acid N-acetyltransferase
LILRAAEPADLDALRALLAVAKLPSDGLADQFPAAYVVACVSGQIVGSAGLERYGNHGLLRSVAVDPRFQRQQIGARLVGDRLDAARLAGLRAVYALTTTAAEYFQRWGFVCVDRAQAPAELRASVEFARACPSDATCLAWTPG